MKTALGKGLGALIPEKKGREIVEVEVERITSGREQPRKRFRDESLKELAASIREKGVLQPVILRRENDGSFNLIAGERRVRASRLAGLKKVPALIKDASPQDSLEIALIENIQRENLNPIETAQALQGLIDRFGLTQEALGGRVGMERVTLANYLRLLKLPQGVKAMVIEGSLSMGHARALLSIEDPAALSAAAARVIKDGLSVREAEGLARNLSSEGKGKKPSAKTAASGARDPHITDLEEKLRKNLATKVSIRHKGNKKGGSIEIQYYSLEELDRLLDLLL